jgi:hypothetical protein
MEQPTDAAATNHSFATLCQHLFALFRYIFRN